MSTPRLTPRNLLEFRGWWMALLPFMYMGMNKIRLPGACMSGRS